MLDSWFCFSSLTWSSQRAQMNWVVLVWLGAWLASAWVARKQYLTTLKESIREHRAAAEPPVLDRSTAGVLNASLSASDHEEVLYALSVLESEQHSSRRPIQVLLNHPAAEVRKKAISVLDAGGDKTVLPQIEVLLSGSNPQVHTGRLYSRSSGSRGPA